MSTLVTMTDPDPDGETRTFRGRTLEEILPQIRAELGPDAIVLRRREGLTGGIGGFFQRSYVEVEAAGPQGAAAARRIEIEAAAEPRNDRATADGMASPAIQLLLDQASPFADQLHAAQRAGDEDDDRSRSERAADILGAAGLYGPQPRVGPPPPPAPPPASPMADEPAPHPLAAFDDEEESPSVAPAEPLDLPAQPAPAPTFVAPAMQLLAPRPAAATTAERRLVEAGLDSALAADLVGEAMVHGVPFGSTRGLKKLVRAALARRIRPLAARGPGARSLAFVGAAGAGKTTAVGHLAAAYAQAGALPVLVIALRAEDGGAALRARLEPADVAVHAAADGAEARRIAELARGAMVVVDTAPVSVRSAAAVDTLAADLHELVLDEVHLALPATLSAAAASELALALDPVGLTHVALTRMEDTEHPGAPIGFCVSSGGPLSYLCERDGIEPADPAALAQRLLP